MSIDKWAPRGIGLATIRSFIFGGVPGSKRCPLLRAPQLAVDDAKRQAFERFAASAIDGRDIDVPYDLPYPKHEYLRWLSRERTLLFHGSPGARRDQIDPRRAGGTDRAGHQRAVYASPWPLYAMWFAVLNRRWPFIWTSNGSRAADGVDQWDRVYWFTVNRWAKRPSLLTDGTLYIFDRHRFTPLGAAADGDEYPDQWISREPVGPIGSLSMLPTDFPFSSSVTKR